MKKTFVLGVTIMLLGFSPIIAADFIFGLNYGWNLFSVPLQGASGLFPSSDSVCRISPIWHWNGQQYVMTAGTTSQPVTLEPGKAYWIKMEDAGSNAQPCGARNMVNVRGGSSYTEFNNYPLHAGWNMVGGLYESGVRNAYPQDGEGGIAFNTVKNNCDVRSGPWRFDGERYVKSSTLDAGWGYWVKVAQACSLHSGPSIPDCSLGPC